MSKKRKKRMAQNHPINPVTFEQLSEMTAQIKHQIAHQSLLHSQAMKKLAAADDSPNPSHDYVKAIKVHAALGKLLNELLACEKAKQCPVVPPEQALAKFMRDRVSPRFAAKAPDREPFIHFGQGQTRKPGSRRHSS